MADAAGTAAAAGAGDGAVVVRQAVQAIDISLQGQTLEIHGDAEPPFRQLMPLDVDYFTTFLLRHPHAVVKLSIKCFILTLNSVEILRRYFANNAMSLHAISLNQVRFNNVNSTRLRRLLSGLHGNTSVTYLDLCLVDGLEGSNGGAALSTLLQHSPHLEKLWCHYLPLGVEGARAMKPGIEANQTVRTFGLDCCDLGDAGLSLIVESLQGKTTILTLDFSENGITSTNGLPLVTQLLRNLPSLRAIYLDFTPGIVDNQDNCGQFLDALQHSQLNTLCMKSCRLPGRFIAALGQTTSIDSLFVYGNVLPLQGEDRECLLRAIPNMRNLRELRMNLDFANESVLSSFRQNVSIQRLYTYIDPGADAEILNRNRRLDVVNDFVLGAVAQQVTTSPISEIAYRNVRLYVANDFIGHETRRSIPLAGIWSKAIERLGRYPLGAAALDNIMRELFVTSWLTPPHQAEAQGGGAASSSMAGNAAPVLVASSAIAASISTGRRSRGPQDDNNDDSTKDNTTENSSSTTTATTLVEPPPSARKRARH